MVGEVQMHLSEGPEAKKIGWGQGARSKDGQMKMLGVGQI